MLKTSRKGKRDRKKQKGGGNMGDSDSNEQCSRTCSESHDKRNVADEQEKSSRLLDVQPSRKRRKSKHAKRRSNEELVSSSSSGGHKLITKRSAAAEDLAATTGRERSVRSTKSCSSHEQNAANADARYLSLASALKRCRGTAATTPSLPEWSGCARMKGRKTFLTPADGKDYDSCKRECYCGFHVEAPEEIPQSLHMRFSSALEQLNTAGFFQYDAVQPGGKRLSRTFVTRTLLGNPGSTYRYLGLRLFSHPWSDVDERYDAMEASHASGGAARGRSTLEGLGYASSTAASLIAIGTVNQSLVDRSNSLLKSEVADHVPNGLVGSADFSLTLINRMEPTKTKKDLRSESIYGMGKVSVSWHMDSGLQDFSTIAVYHLLRNANSESDLQESNSFRKPALEEVPWKVALRVTGETDTPALAVPLSSGSLYYLLDDFNHNHEHAVLAGSDLVRYSSTHRVAREGRGTWQYIREKCDKVLASKTIGEQFESLVSPDATTARMKQMAKELRVQQQLFTEVEFEWLRQWQIQGQLHADLHPYWHKPMKKLESAFECLEKRTLVVLKCLENASVHGKSRYSAMIEDIFDIMIEAIEDRSRQRLSWMERIHDPIFDSMPPGKRPIQISVLDRHTVESCRHIPEDLAELRNTLRRWRSAFVESRGKTEQSTADNRAGNKGKRSSLTKKEQKKVASNWENMKLLVGKTKKTR